MPTHRGSQEIGTSGANLYYSLPLDTIFTIRSPHRKITNFRIFDEHAKVQELHLVVEPEKSRSSKLQLFCSGDLLFEQNPRSAQRGFLLRKNTLSRFYYYLVTVRWKVTFKVKSYQLEANESPHFLLESETSKTRYLLDQPACDVATTAMPL